MNSLVSRIVNGAHAPLPASTSPALRGLVTGLLSKAPAARPSVTQVLSLPFVRREMANYIRDQVLMRVESNSGEAYLWNQSQS